MISQRTLVLLMHFSWYLIMALNPSNMLWAMQYICIIGGWKGSFSALMKCSRHSTSALQVFISILNNLFIWVISSIVAILGTAGSQVHVSRYPDSRMRQQVTEWLWSQAESLLYQLQEEVMVQRLYHTSEAVVQFYYLDFITSI